MDDVEVAAGAAAAAAVSLGDPVFKCRNNDLKTCIGFLEFDMLAYLFVSLLLYTVGSINVWSLHSLCRQTRPMIVSTAAFGLCRGDQYSKVKVTSVIVSESRIWEDPKSHSPPKNEKDFHPKIIQHIAFLIHRLLHLLVPVLGL